MHLFCTFFAALTWNFHGILNRHKLFPQNLVQYNTIIRNTELLFYILISKHERKLSFLWLSACIIAEATMSRTVSVRLSVYMSELVHATSYNYNIMFVVVSYVAQQVRLTPHDCQVIGSKLGGLPFFFSSSHFFSSLIFVIF